MKRLTLLTGAGVLSLAAIGCGPDDVGDDTDDNKSFYVDGYSEPSAPAPATNQTSCNYQKTAELGLPTGVGPGQILPVSHSWQGFRPGDPNPSVVNVAEFFDCDGSKGIDAVVWDVSQYG